MERFKQVEKASIFGIFGNFFLLIIKLFVAFSFNSQAMIADTFNSAGDILSSIMTFIGNKISSKPVDRDHNLGHGKAEYIYSMLVSVIMILMALKILKTSVISIFVHNNYIFSKWLVIVCIITIIVKFLLYLYTHRVYKKYNNLLMKANSIDHRNDSIMTFLNLISCLLSSINIYYFDGLVGSIIAIWIIMTSINIFIESYNVLMDKSASDEIRKKVYDIVKRHDEIKRIYRFTSTPIGYKYQMSLNIYVDGNMSTFESHNIADKLEKEIVNEIDEIYLAVIHVNPIKISE